MAHGHRARRPDVSRLRRPMGRRRDQAHRDDGRGRAVEPLLGADPARPRDGRLPRHPRRTEGAPAGGDARGRQGDPHPRGRPRPAPGPARARPDVVRVGSNFGLLVRLTSQGTFRKESRWRTRSSTSRSSERTAPKLMDFYGQLFGWTVNADNPMNYGMVDAAESGIGGGIGSAPDGSSHLTFYVGVDDLQAYLDKAESLGGKTVMPVTEIPNIVTFALIADPEGHVLGIVKN